MLTRRTQILVVALGVTVLSEAHGGGGYLSRTGSPPLRFGVAMDGHVRIQLPPLFSANSAGNTETSAPSPVVPAKVTIPQPGESISAPFTSTNEITFPPPNASEQNSPIEPIDSGAFHSTASDLLTVTPQMLVEYFTPAANGTNHSHTAIVVPVPVGFTPPMPKNTP